MTVRYLYSGGSNTSPYDTWAKAATAMSTITAIPDAAGDTLYVATDHAETGTGGNLTFHGTAASPSQVICASRSANPPTASGTGGKLTSNAASTNYQFLGAGTFFQGLVFEAGSGQSTTCSLSFSYSNNSSTILDNCAIRLLSTGTNSRINIGGGGDSQKVQWNNTTVRFGAAGQRVNFPVFGTLIWTGGGIEAGGTSPTGGIVGCTGGGKALLSGLDLSSAAQGVNIFAAGNGMVGTIRDSRLPTSWNGALVTGGLHPGDRLEMYNCSDGANNYKIRMADYAGTMTEDTGVYRNSGYSMDGTAMSWNVTGSSNANWPLSVCYTPEFGVWVSGSSGYTSVTVAVATNNITLTDQQCWLEVVSLDSASYPLGTWHSDDSANVGTLNWTNAASNQTADGTSTWTGVPGTPVLQKLTAAIAPGLSGYILCRVGVVLDGSQSVYIDPHPQLA